MTDINTAFCRHLLAQVMPDVRKVTTPAQRKATWVYDHGRDHWEFHGPDGFYWHGSADNAWDARYKGWSAWLAKFHPEAIADDADECQDSRDLAHDAGEAT